MTNETAIWAAFAAGMSGHTSVEPIWGISDINRSPKDKATKKRRAKNKVAKQSRKKNRRKK